MVVDSVNHLRTTARITINDLAARLSTAGWPVSEATLAGILSGRKRGSMTVTEVLAFAWALDTPPMYLMAGLPDHACAPDSPMWEDGAYTPEIAAWIAGETTRYQHTAGETPAVLQRKYGELATQNIVRHTALMERMRWQAAGIIAFGTDEPDLLAIFKATLRMLAEVRASERTAPAEWRVPFEPLPHALEQLDDLDYGDTMPHKFTFRDLTIPELLSLTSDEEIMRQRQQRRAGMDASRLLQDQEKNGTSTHAAE